MADYDLAIIGGGINGTGIARDAAGRGLRVLLLEQNDLGSGTSSASTKLIHGGLRYLEHGALRLVREALTEREVLLRMAPHLIRPMRFVLPAVPGPRSPLMLRLGLVPLRLARRPQDPAAVAPGSTSPTTSPASRCCGNSAPASNTPTAGSTMPGWSRSTPLDAAERGAKIRTRTRRDPRRARGRLAADPQRAGPARGRDRARPGQCRRALGRHRRGDVLRMAGRPPVRLVKGSHIVVREAVRPRLAATSSRTPTSASCSRCRSPTTSR